jgi:methionyl-tRNA formyltransferase
MRLVCFLNNWTGWQVLEFLHAQGDEIAGLVLHPAAKRAFGDEILSTFDPGPDAVFDGSTLRDPGVVGAIGDLRPDLGISVLFDYILRRPLLDLFPRGVINLHPAYLPYNRGQYPNVWSIVEGTPAGTTLHYIDEGIDTGDVIAQRRVEMEPTDTGETLYRRLERASVSLFRDTWPLIRAGDPPRFPQPEGGTSHRTADVERIDAIDPDRRYTARELIDILRARTFPPYDGAYFDVNGRRINLRLELTERPSPDG